MHRRTSSLLSFVLVSLFGVGCSSPPPIKQVKIPIPQRIDAAYSPLANRFEILNCVFWEGFCVEDGAYRKYWAERFGFGPEEQRVSALYGKIRFKYYEKAGPVEKSPTLNPNGIFASTEIKSDPIADAFYSSMDLPEALSKISSTVSLEDREKIEKIFLEFDQPLSELVKESEVFKTSAEHLNHSLHEAPAIQISDFIPMFYKVKNPDSFHVRFVWLPPIHHELGNPAGDYLILLENPKNLSSNPDDDLALHEYAHAVSGQASSEQKVKFTHIFLNACPRAHHLKRHLIWEEPVSVALGQMLYLDTAFPDRYKKIKKWYHNKWVSSFAKKIYPLVKSYYQKQKPIDDDFMKSAGELCRHQPSHFFK